MGYLQMLILLICGLVSFQLKAEEIIFVIPPGTQDSFSDWNSPEEPLIARVGDVLTIINQDSVPHTLHTYNQRPCEHGKAMPPEGGTWSCLLTVPYSSFDEEHPARDHDIEELKFWIIVLPADDSLVPPSAD